MSRYDKNFRNNFIIGMIFIISFISLALIGILSGNIIKSLSEKNIENENLISALNDTIRISKNKEGLYVSQIQGFEMQSANDFAKLNLKDKDIQELQKEVERYKKKELQYLAVIQGYTEMDTTVKTKVIITENPNKPIYEWDASNEWISLTGTSSFDKTNTKLKVFDKYSVASHREKNKLITEVTNHNPYSVTTGIRSFSTSLPKQKKFGLGINVGWSPWNGFYGGVGINYNIIPLW